MTVLERDITTTLGASEIAAVLGEDPYRTADDVLREKVFREKFEMNEHMIRGVCLEPGLLNWWEILEGRKLDARQRLFRHPNGWACATCDGVAGLHLVEIKCPAGGKSWNDRTGEHPFHYRLQVTWQIGVASDATGQQHTGELCAGPVWGKLLRFQVEFDAQLFASMLEAGEAFMKRVQAAKQEATRG